MTVDYVIQQRQIRQSQNTLPTSTKTMDIVTILTDDPPAAKTIPAKQKRKRNKIWLNPLFSVNVSTNIEFPVHN